MDVLKIVWAVLLGFMIWRMIPVAREWLKNGPRGTSSEWLTTALLLGGVILFVLFLISSLRAS
jgi:hypothetical protein